MLLIDSSVYIDWLKSRFDPREILEPWIVARAIATCGVVRAEVLRGIIDPRQKARIGNLFDLLEEVPTDPILWREVADLGWELDRKGIILPMTDLIIAACARSVNATIVTFDVHFSKVPGIKVRREVPRLR